jgi:hypothetical protein
MAAVTYLQGAATTTAAITYTSNSTTPGGGSRLLVAYVCVTGNTETTWAMSDSLGGSWTKIRRQVKATSVDIAEIWVRNSLLPSTPGALTCTYSKPGAGSATGCLMAILDVTGMTRTGSNAVRGQGGQDNRAGSTTPAATFAQAALTANPTITAIHCATQTPTTTYPTGFTDLVSTGDLTPTTGFRVGRDDSGFTGSTVTWGGTSSSAYSTVAIELDTSALDTTPPVPDVLSNSAARISSQAGKDSTTVVWESSEDFTHYMLRAVPDAGSAYTAGTLIEQDQNPSSGGTAGTDYTSTITDDELIAAGLSGSILVKLFTQDAAGNWST